MNDPILRPTATRPEVEARRADRRHRERVTLDALAARVAVLETVIQPPPVPPPSDPENVRKALREAVMVLWLGDSADYRSALWTVVSLLWPGLPEEPDLREMVKALDALGAS